MWLLSMRDQDTRQWTELGEVPDIRSAAACILKLESDPNGALFFRVYADPLATKANDAEILSRLEFQGQRDFYLLKRRVQ